MLDSWKTSDIQTDKVFREMANHQLGPFLQVRTCPALHPEQSLRVPAAVRLVKAHAHMLLRTQRLLALSAAVC
jgi:hypothetical protein